MPTCNYMYNHTSIDMRLHQKFSMCLAEPHRNPSNRPLKSCYCRFHP